MHRCFSIQNIGITLRLSKNHQIKNGVFSQENQSSSQNLHGEPNHVPNLDPVFLYRFEISNRTLCQPHIRDTASCQFWLVSLALLYKRNSTATSYHLLVDGQIDF